MNIITLREGSQVTLSNIVQGWKDNNASYSSEKLTFICYKTLEAMVYLHSKGLYYGNLTPQTIDITLDYLVRLNNYSNAIKIPTG